MWADNETEVDYLGFDFLVDGLVVALTEPKLLPLTVGLLGDWGSGKSSLMKITRQELLAVPSGEKSLSPYLCVEFSPWRYEDYDDVKLALMATILDKIEERAGTEQAAQVKRVRRGLAKLRRASRKGGRILLSTAGVTGPALLQAMGVDVDPTIMDVVTAGIGAVQGDGKPADSEEPPPAGPIVDIGSFRTEFEKLVMSLEGVQAVIVFIDDLDRCLPQTVVDTFEAIRLFLNTPKTAYVVAANQPVVESAIDSRYPEHRRPEGGGIGADYLEKMLQLKVAVPPLSAPEADTYVNLLLAELHLDDDQFEKVLADVKRRRATNNLQTAFNLGIAAEVLGDVPPGLTRDLAWAADITDVLGTALRGNPRQLKRFLNNLLLKHRTAQRRHVDLELSVLAKLMVLEDQHIADFQRLFDWQLLANGPIPELAQAEAAVASGDAPTTAEPEEAGKPASGSARVKPRIDDEVETWMNKTHIKTWLGLQPKLGTTDLRPYFTYSRDKLTFGVAVTRLAPQLQKLLVDIQGVSPVVRRKACGVVATLPGSDRAQIVEALTASLYRQPTGPAFTALLDLAARASDTVPAVCAALTRIPLSALRSADVPVVVKQLPDDHPAVIDLLDRWENGGVAALSTNVRNARQARQRRGRR